MDNASPRETALFVLLTELPTTLEAFVTNTLADTRYDCFRFAGPAAVVVGASLYVPRTKYDVITLPYDCLEDNWRQLCVTRHHHRHHYPSSALPAHPCAEPQLSAAVSKMTLQSSSDQ